MSNTLRQLWRSAARSIKVSTVSVSCMLLVPVRRPSRRAAASVVSGGDWNECEEGSITVWALTGPIQLSVKGAGELGEGPSVPLPIVLFWDVLDDDASPTG